MQRPREITVAAVFAFVGSGLFIFAGIAVGLLAGFYVYVFHREYPGVDLSHPENPDALYVRNLFTWVVGIFLLLGSVGIATARGLLRMRPWARISALTWSIASTLLWLLIILFRPGLGAETRMSLSPIVVLLMLSLPLNAWWFMLFRRPAVVNAFGSKPIPIQNSGLSRLRQSEMAKSFAIPIAVILFILFGFGGWKYVQHRKLTQEIEQSRDAVASAKTWHYHTVREIGGLPQDLDIVTTCPSFQHITVSSVAADGTPVVNQTINYFGTTYRLVNGQWVDITPRSPYSSQQKPEIFECARTILGADENSLPYPAILEDGSIVRAGEETVEGTTCRDYVISVPTPHDPAEKNFAFTMCINEADHLPRETRRVRPGDTQERVTRYSEWSTSLEPRLPPDFSK